jgi:hypothetical protein
MRATCLLMGSLPGCIRSAVIGRDRVGAARSTGFLGPDGGSIENAGQSTPSRPCRRAVSSASPRRCPTGLVPAHPPPAPRGFAAPVTIRPRALELQPHVTVIQDLQTVVGEGRAQDVLAQALATLLLVGSDFGLKMQVKSARATMARTSSWVRSDAGWKMGEPSSVSRRKPTSPGLWVRREQVAMEESDRLPSRSPASVNRDLPSN